MSAIFKAPSTGLFVASSVLFTMAAYGLFRWYVAWQPVGEWKSTSGILRSAECVEIAASGGNRRGTTLWAQPKLSYQFEYQNRSIFCNQWGRNRNAAFPKMAQCSAYISSLSNEKLLVWFDENEPTKCVLNTTIPWPFLELCFVGASLILVAVGGVLKSRLQPGPPRK